MFLFLSIGQEVHSNGNVSDIKQREKDTYSIQKVIDTVKRHLALDDTRDK